MDTNSSIIINDNGVITIRNGLVSATLMDDDFYICIYDKEIVKTNNFHCKDFYFIIPQNSELIIDFICGNKWPDCLDKYFSLVLQRLV